MFRGIGARRGWLLPFLGAGCLTMLARAAVGQATTQVPSAAGVSISADRFRAASALQNRALYDLAAAEWETLADEFPDDPLAAEARYQRGVCLFHLKRYADATRQFQQTLQSGDPLDPELEEKCLAHLGLAHFNLASAAAGDQRTGEFEAAAKALRAQLAKFPNGALAADSHFFLCEALYALDRRQESIDAYRLFLERFPTHSRRGDALYALGVALQETDQLAAAAPTLQQFSTEFPRHKQVSDAQARRADALVTLGQTQLRDGDPAAAEAAFSEFLADYPADGSAPDVRLLRATARHQRGDFKGGIADAVALLVGNPPRPIASSALYVRGLCEIGLGKPATATETLERLARDDPHFAALDRVLYDLAWAYQDAGKPIRSLETFARLAESCPDSPLAGESLFRVGEAHYAAGEFAIAAEQYRAAVERAADPAVAERAAHKLAWCHFEQRQFDAAEDTFDRQLAAHPHGPLAGDARLMRAECQFRTGKFRQACASYAAALDDATAAREKRPSALVHATQSAAQIGDWQRCLALADRALREGIDDRRAAEVRCERGNALYRLGRADEAEAEFAALAGVERPEIAVRARFLLGEVYRTRGRRDEAIRAYFQAAYGPADDHADVQHWQSESLYAAAECLTETGRAEAAQKLYQELVKRFPKSARAAAARFALEQTTRR